MNTLSVDAARSPTQTATGRQPAIPDCWLEIDLFWFQGQPVGEKIDELLERLAPLWSHPQQRRYGLVFCVGWMFDAVLGWNRDRAAAIPTCNGPNYERWTYERLADVLSELRRKAALRGLPDLHLGLLLHGGKDFSVAAEYNPALRKGRTDRHDDQYGYNIRGQWFDAHPEVADERFDYHLHFGAPVRLPEDEKVWKGPGSPTFGDYTAAKLADMTRAVGFDTVVFRDCILTSNHDNDRGRPTMPPEARRAWTTAIINMLAAIKARRPELLTMGYSGYQSQMITWRATGFDLQAVAESGHLDLWITQTWASAFQDYWRTDTLGYTPSLINALTDQVMISGTPAQHLFLIETFDAWEPFESLRDFPGKIDWLFQALGHAGVHRPDGSFQRSAGYYISWMNKGQRLLSREDVARLEHSTERLIADLKGDPRPAGPCLVFDHGSFLHLLDHPVDHCRGEVFDNWLAMLAKFGTGVLGATRAEWLPKVFADGLIYPSPAKPPAGMGPLLRERWESGTPILFMGQADSFDPALRETLGIACEASPPTAALAVAADVNPEWAARIGCSALVLNQRRRSLKPSADWHAILSALGGPVFAKHRTLPCWIWEPPAWVGGLELTCDNVQSLQTFWLVAMAAGEGWRTPRWQNLQQSRPAIALFWRYSDGRTAMLLGNLENGICGHSQLPVNGTLLDARGWEPTLGARHMRLKATPEGLDILLAGHQRGILVAKPDC